MKQFIKFLSITVIASLFLTATAFAEKVTFVKEYNYNASDLDSKVSSRAIALEQVKRLLLEELGTYLISETEVKNFRLTKDQVTTYSAGVVSAEVMDEKWDGKTYYLKAKVSADPAEVAKSLQNIANDKQKSKELEDVRKKAKDAMEEIERLKKEIAGLKQSTKKQKEYAKAVKELSAIDWTEKGANFGKSGMYKEALDAFNKAIELYPQFAEAYGGRGMAYSELGNYQQAINDYNKAIQLNPHAFAYSNRGDAYSELGNHQQAINDYNKAIQLNPQYAATYNGRGIAYSELGSYQQAINDFNKSIELDPRDTKVYRNLGLAYAHLGDAQKAIENLKISAKLGDKEAQDFLKKKGIGW